MRRKLRINVDMDGIIVDLLGHWLREICTDFPRINVTKDDITEWDMGLCDPLKHIGSVVIRDYLRRPNFYEKAEAIPGSIITLSMLAVAGHELKIVTATPAFDDASDRDIEAQKLRWLALRVPHFNESNVIFTRHGDTKIQHEADVFIDDHPKTLVSYRNAHPRALVCGIRYPYNAHLADVPGIHLLADHNRTIDAWMTFQDLVLR